MRPVSDAFNAAVRETHERVARLLLLDQDLATVEVIEAHEAIVLEGVVTSDASRRRSCSFSLANDSGEWTPAGPADPLFPNRLIALERGIVVDGVPEYARLGVFMIDRPAIRVSPEGSTIQITGQDRVKLASKSRFTVPTTFEAGVAIADVVQAVAQSAGMGATRYRLNDAGKSLAADRTFETDADRWPSIVTLAGDYALELYVDADGFVVLEPAVTADSLPAPVWAFARGAEAIMLGITKEFGDDRLYNHVRVSGESANLAPVAAEARDLNPASPAYNPDDGTGPIGDRLYSYVSAMIRTIEQAAEVAAATLLRVALIEEAITVPSVVHPALEAGDVVAIVEDLSRTDDTYLVDSLSIPLGAGAMTLQARKVRSLT